jgi:hypothetical protein
MSAQRPEEAADLYAVLDKAKSILEQHKLEITKTWLSRLISEIDDLHALEQFPTQETIRTSVELIEGLANCLSDEETLSQFGPGGLYHRQASALGLLQHDESGGIGPLADSLDALEEAIWERLSAGLRQQDREILALVRIMRMALHRVMTTAAEAYHLQSSAELDRLAHTDTLMRAHIRDTDIPCRYGGDEFIVLMPEADKNAIQAVGRRIAETISKTRVKLGGGYVSLEVSFGASSCPAEGTSADVLLKQADTSLYAAKERKTGRGGRS